MNTLEAIFIAILFLVPGFFVDIIRNKFFQKANKKCSDFENTVRAVMISLIIIFFNIIIINFINMIFDKDRIDTIRQLQGKLINLKFLIGYLILTFIVCILYSFFCEYIIGKLNLKLLNYYREKNNLSSIENSTTVWEFIFENPEIDLNNRYVTIEKDGKIITQGGIKHYSAPDYNNKELLLKHTDMIKEILEEDKTWPKDERLFDKIEIEYFHFETGILVKFYDMNKYNEYTSNNN